MICETCNEKILYEVTIFDSMTFCDESCLDAYIEENTTIEDVDPDDEINNNLNL